jgi:hypothetical protein
VEDVACTPNSYQAITERIRQFGENIVLAFSFTPPELEFVLSAHGSTTFPTKLFSQIITTTVVSPDNDFSFNISILTPNL